MRTRNLQGMSLVALCLDHCTNSYDVICGVKLVVGSRPCSEVFSPVFLPPQSQHLCKKKKM